MLKNAPKFCRFYCRNVKQNIQPKYLPFFGNVKPKTFSKSPSTSPCLPVKTIWPGPNLFTCTN